MRRNHVLAESCPGSCNLGLGHAFRLFELKLAARIILTVTFAFCGLAAAMAGTNYYSLGVSAAPTNNPLKGFMPYQGAYGTFPYSMEWNYIPLRSLMSGPTNFNWTSLEALISNVAGRGHQTVFRVYLDYPTLPTGIPQYLLDAGLATNSYTDYGNNGISVSPDYENPLLDQALTNFIAALGARYDGDPRIGFITLGLLGFWGEWHTYPHDSWFASITVQDEVLTAYEAAFAKTKLLVRWPSGTNPPARRIGYHDDSFAYETIDPPDWMFLGLLKAAGETNKWLTQPIGGEVRPEVQLCMWDTSQTNCVPAGQEFTNCVDLTPRFVDAESGGFQPRFHWSAAGSRAKRSTEIGLCAVRFERGPGRCVRFDAPERERGVAEHGCGAVLLRLARAIGRSQWQQHARKHMGDAMEAFFPSSRRD